MHPSELESRIFQLRARVRRLLALHGLSLIVALLVPLVIAAVLADWLIHLDAAVRLVVPRRDHGGMAVKETQADGMISIVGRWPGP